MIVLDCQTLSLSLLDLTKEELSGGYISKMNAGEKPFKVFFYIFEKVSAKQDASGKEKSLMGFQRKVAPFCEKYVSCGERKNWVGTLQNLLLVYAVNNLQKHANISKIFLEISLKIFFFCSS